MENKNIITVKDVSDVIEAAVPSGLQESWDNSGLLIGFEDSAVSKILTCLELNMDVVKEAQEIGADMVITHHPVIFTGIRSICDGNYQGRMITELIRAGISVYSCHTPFDKVKGGNNDIIMEKFGLVSVKNLAGDDVEPAKGMMKKMDEADIGRIGRFKEPVKFSQVIEMAASKLEMSIRQLRAVGSLDREITTVGVCTGAGSDLLDMAAAAGCDMFITGDVKYHEAQHARELGICVLDAGHYDTEKFFGEAMKELLENKLKDVEINASSISIDPFVVL